MFRIKSVVAMKEMFCLIVGALIVLFVQSSSPAATTESKERRLLYVATPGIRDYLEYGGHGLLVFDIDQGHKFVRRIPTAGLAENGKPSNVKGIAASIPLQHVFITTLKKMMAIDLLTEKLLWEKSYEGGCDRLAISP